MKQISFYRILTYLLFPFVILFGFMALIMLMIALANPAALLPVFLLVCVVIYTFASYSFLNKGIAHGKPCRPSLKDLIKVNAYVSMVFGGWWLVQSVAALANPSALRESVSTALAEQKTALPQGITESMMLQGMKGVLYFLIIFCIALLIHISISFRLLKAYRHVFGS
jgi:hypothetical protein